MRTTAPAAMAVAAAVLLGACKDDITVGNYNSPTTTGVAADPSSLQLLANGVVFQLGSQAPGYITGMGQLGRESYSYTPTEGRNFTGWVQGTPIDRAGFGGTSLWNGRYTNLRNIFNLQEAITAANITAPQKAVASAFGKTMEALELYYTIATRDTIGIPIEVSADLSFVSPFVTRDSAYRYISAQLESAYSDMTTNATVAFPFTVNLQFTGVASPATAPTQGFRQFNRALAARIFATRGSLGMNCGAATCYQQAITAANAAFIPSGTPTRTTLDAGVYNIFATSTGATQNTLSQATSGGANQFAHPSILRDTVPPYRDANGRSVYASTENASRGSDLRARAKIRTLATPAAAASSIQSSSLTTPYGFAHYPTASTPIPIIRGEEVLLIRAEANIQTGALAAGLADLNAVRTVSGGLTALPAFANTASAIDALLYERRMSLLWEGHRIVDVRRLNRLSTIPVDKVSVPGNTVQHYVHAVLPVPQAECLSRALTPELQPANCR